VNKFYVERVEDSCHELPYEVRERILDTYVTACACYSEATANSIADALNAQAGVVEALPKPMPELDPVEENRHGREVTDFEIGYSQGWNDCLEKVRDALAAVKGVDRG
jgi:hypothetical protein